MKNQYLDVDNQGEVTIVSARQPNRNTGNNEAYQSQNQNRSNKYSREQQQQQYIGGKPPHLSFSQRIENTSTPLQIPAPSASVRSALPNSANFSIKDGSTDV